MGLRAWIAALAVMSAWGFSYKSLITWIKDRPGTGYWVRNRVELLLIGTRGSVPAPAPGEQPPQVVEAPRGRHSEKPDVFAEMIERLFPNVPRLEMFARRARDGWECWGNEAPATLRKRGRAMTCCAGTAARKHSDGQGHASGPLACALDLIAAEEPQK